MNKCISVTSVVWIVALGMPGFIPVTGEEVPSLNRVLRLSDALERATQESPSLRSAELGTAASMARVLQASVRPNPELEIELEDIGLTGDETGFGNLVTTVRLAQLVELGGKRPARMRVASLDEARANVDLRATRLDGARDVTKAFFAVLSGQERLATLKEIHQLAREVVDAVAERVDAGRESPLELTKARIGIAETGAAVRNAERELSAARYRLAATWGALEPDFESVAGALAEVKALPPLRDLMGRLDTSPLAMARDTESELRKALLEEEKSNAVPDMTVSVGLAREEASGGHVIEFGVGFPLPLFDRNQGGVQAATLDVTQGEAERAALLSAQRAQLRELFEAVSSSYDQAMTVRDEILPAATTTFEGVRETYRDGKVGYLDVLDSQKTLFEIKLRYLDVLTAYHLGGAEAEHLLGGAIWPSSTPTEEP